MSGAADLKPDAARARFRDGLVATTSGWCDGWTRANLITVPAAQAWDVLLFAQRNPRSCPVLDVLEAGAVSGPCWTATSAPTCPATASTATACSPSSPPTCSTTGATTWPAS